MQHTNIKASSLLKIINIFTIVAFILVGVMFYLELTKPNQNYYAKSADNTVNRMITLSEPNVSIHTLLRWASIAITTAYTLDFVEYQKTLSSLESYFTKAGYKNFLEAADARLQDIIKQKLVVTAVVAGQPIVLDEGMLDGAYSWRLQIPLLLSYQGASEKSTKQSLAVTILVVRVPTSDADSGIGIAQLQDTSTFNN